MRLQGFKKTLLHKGVSIRPKSKRKFCLQDEITSRKIKNPTAPEIRKNSTEKSFTPKTKYISGTIMSYFQ